MTDPTAAAVGHHSGRPTVTLDEFRVEAEAFLAAHAAPRSEQRAGWGVGSDVVGLFDPPETELSVVEAAREWRQKLFDAGLGWVTGPRAHGGRELPRSYERSMASLEAEFDTPDQMRLSVGLGMVGPTIAAHGSDVAKDQYLAPIYRADVVACQLFSEPEAGSDLSAVRTTATRIGADRWRLDGQKVWTSGAHFSHVGMVLARTGEPGSRHRGLTMFLIDMHAPGVDVRPLRQMTGDASFDEVFLDGVETADELRLGEVDGGWAVAMTTLVNERGSIGAGGRGVGGGDHLLQRLCAIAEHNGRSEDPLVRQALADLHTRVTVARLFQARMAAIMANDEDPGAIMAVGKIMLSENLKRTAAVASSLAGPALVADIGVWGTAAWSELILGAPGLRIGGGTDEVQKNMLGERVLGLPREPR